MASGQHSGAVVCMNDEASASGRRSEGTVHFSIATITIDLLSDARGLELCFSWVCASTNVLAYRGKV